MYKEAKEKELSGYQNIEKDKSMLESFLALEFSELKIIASKLSQSRQKEAKDLEKQLEAYLTTLKLPVLTFEFTSDSLSQTGIDSVEVMLGYFKNRHA